MSTGGLLVITAHPDDEVLIAGGTLAACADAGMPTAVVCLTRGEEGPISDPALATRGTLAEVRARELRAACDQLGVQWVKCYRRPDGQLRWSDGTAIVRQLVGIIEARRPHAIITFGEEGLYYHPDHIAAYEYTLRAVRKAPHRPALYRSVWPEELMAEFVEELNGRGLPSDLWEIEPEQFGVSEQDRAGEIVLDVRTHAAQKLNALRCHRTQLTPCHAFAGVPDDVFERYLGVERFVPVGSTEDAGWLVDAVAAVSGDA